MDALEEYLIGGEAKATPPTKPELKLVPDARPVFNPGNLRPSGSATGFQQFKTPEEGISAVDKNLQSYGKKGINTLRGVISTWAPPSENDTNAYIKNASQRIGIDPDAPIDLSDPVQRHLVSAAIISHEQGPRNIFAKRQTAIQAQQTGKTLDPLEEYLTGKIAEPKEPMAQAQVIEEPAPQGAAFGVGNAYTRKLAAQPRENRATGAPLAVAENVGSMIGNLGVQTLGSLKGVLGSIPEAIRTGQAPGPIGEKIRKEFVEKHQFAPTSELGQTMGEQIGGVIEATKMPPFVPGMMELAGVQAGKQVVETAKPKPLPAKISYADFQKMQQEKAQATQPIAAAPVATSQTAVGPQSVGAAALTPEQQRIARASSLDEPINLSKDQATRNPADVRFARETAKDPVLGQELQNKYASDNAKIQRNLDFLSEQTGAEKIGIPPSDLGESLIETVLPYKTTRKTEVSNSYTQARDAGEMAELVSYKFVTDYINGKTQGRPTQLTKNPILGVIDEELKINDPQGTGKISLNAMEDIRQLIVDEIDPAQKGSIYHGKNLKKAVDKATEQSGGDLYKQARKLNADYMTEFEDTPVIKSISAMKKGTTQRAVAIEDLVDKSILRGPASDVKQLFVTLEKAGPEGQKMINELKGYIANKIKEEATKGVTLDINGKPYVSTKNLDTIIKKLDKSGKLELLFGKQVAEKYRTLNDVTKDIQTVPVGTTNPSGTSAQLLGALAEMGIQGATTGVPLPVVMIGKHFYGKHQTTKKLNKIKEFVDYGKQKP
jgi:hypothetical protein